MSRPPRRPRLLACDLDGTLLTSDGRITDAVAAALARAAAAGIALAVITARPGRDVRPEVSAAVPGSAYWAYSNGAVLHAPGDPRPRRVLGFAPAEATALVEAVRAVGRGWSCALDLVDRTVLLDPFPAAAAEHWSRVVRHGPGEWPVLAGPVPKLLVHTGVRTDAAVVAQVQAAVGAAALATASGGSFVELVPPGSGKAAALRALCAELGLAESDTAAVGDGLNDLGMFAAAGLSAAPANAPADVRTAADLILPSNDEDAVAALIDILLTC
ncbi:HAD family hydrolase [Streptomyces sp. NPDC089919]|uniref:HAD family hydrolase n=1 Tax=Streptomyces sp. NPDC089919 TaxID=3155188 RepID=UPI003442CD85